MKEKLSQNNQLITCGILLNSLLMSRMSNSNHIGLAVTGFILGGLLVATIINLKKNRK